MDSIELHERVHHHITNGDNTDRTSDAVMWVVRAALANKDIRIAELEEENRKLRETIAARIVADEQKCQEAITEDPTHDWMHGRLVGLQRARDIVRDA